MIIWRNFDVRAKCDGSFVLGISCVLVQGVQVYVCTTQLIAHDTGSSISKRTLTQLPW